MAIRVRADKVSINDGQGEDPTVIVQASLFDAVANQVIASQTFQFSLAGIRAMTAAQKRAFVVNAVDTWAAEVEANAASAAPLLPLVGVSKVVPKKAVP